MTDRKQADEKAERGVTNESPGARSMPENEHTHPDGARCPTCPVIPRPSDQAAKGSETRVVRCPIHGIAFDGEREVCPECAKPARV
jgi:hypothetical protein